LGIRQSMGRPGSALDNAVIESWHSTLEFELRRIEHFTTNVEARAQVAELQALAIAGRDLSSEEFWKMWWQRLEVEHDRDQALARLAEAELERRELAKERTDSIDHARRWKALAVSFWAERNRAREQLATRSAS